MDITKPVDVRVTYRTGAYITQTVRGCRASSTNAPRVAIQALVHKVFPGHGCEIRELDFAGQPVGCSMWRIDPR